MVRRVSLVLVVVAVLSAIAPVAVSAEEPGGITFYGHVPGPRVTVRAGTRPIFGTQSSKPAPRPIFLAGEPTADIQVTYSGFSAQAKAAFQAAIDVWEHAIVSPIPIHVAAAWEPLGEFTLGAAGPESLVFGSDGYAHPIALAEAICSCEKKAGNEISASFNSQRTDWYLGADGNVPANKFDFFSLVLHEIGHGLGFLSSFEVDGAIGYWGYWNGSKYLPMRFDSFEMTAATGGNRLIDESVYPNDSAALKAQLTDGSVFFNGPSARAAAGKRVKLYAPSPWDPGSSNSHVDEDAFPRSHADTLMSPIQDPGEFDPGPGPITLGMLEDIGWTVGSTTGPGDPPANDPFASFQQISSLPFASAGIDNTNAGLEAAEPQPTCSDIAKTVWYRLTPSRNYSVSFRATPSTGIDIVLAVWEGTSLGALTERACADNAIAGIEETATLSVQSGHTYYVQVGGYAGADTSGTFTVGATRGAGALANDNFARAASAAMATAYTATTTGATVEPGEPTPSCAPSAGKTVWYKHTPSVTRKLVATTGGSNFDTVIAIYTGADLGSLTLVGCNDNRAIDNLSKLKFTATAGTTYYFQVGGNGGAGGTLKFKLKRP